MAYSVALVLPIFIFFACATGLAVGLLVVANLLNPNRLRPVESAPYESGVDPIHDTHRRFDVRFYLLAIAFLVFDVEVLFLYPWAVAWQPERTAETRRQGDAVRQGDTVMGRQREEETARGQDEQSGRATRGQGDAERGGQTSLPASQSPGLLVSKTAFPGAMVFLALLTVGFVYDWRKGVFQWR
jgi:NADH-quinone oxidoreductase subunit A